MRRTSQRVTLLMLVLASVTVLTLDYHGTASKDLTKVRSGVLDGLAPIQRVIASVLHPIGDAFVGAAHYGAVQQQNEVLQEQIGRLRQQVAADAVASEQARQILKLQALPFVGNTQQVDAEVLSGPTSDFAYTLEIDKGTSSGVGVGEPVVGDAGFVGTVISAGRTSAQVQLLQDSHTDIGVRLGVAGQATGVVTGQGRDSPLGLQLLAGAGTVHKGEWAYTSGTTAAGASAYPAGIPVATVTAVHRTPGDFNDSFTLEPLVNPATLQYVAVLRWLPPA
jgi:rod shape-determining protein MreC